MREFGLIPTTIWDDPAFRSLSPEAQLLLMYLVSCRHATMSGCYRLPFGYITEDLKTGSETLSERFAELNKNGFATYDEASQWVFLNRFFEWSKIQNLNQMKHVIGLLEKTPSEPFGMSLITVLEPFRTLIKDDDKGFRNRCEAVFERLGEPFRIKGKGNKPSQLGNNLGEGEQSREVSTPSPTRTCETGAHSAETTLAKRLRVQDIEATAVRAIRLVGEDSGQ